MDLKDAIGFFSWNVQEDKVFGDPVFAYIYATCPHEMQAGAPIATVIRNIIDGDLQRVARALHETIISGKPCHQNYTIAHPGGRRLLVTAQGRCLRDAAGVPSLYVGSVGASEVTAATSLSDPLETHCREALRLAKRRRHALAERYLSSALNVLGRSPELS